MATKTPIGSTSSGQLFLTLFVTPKAEDYPLVLEGLTRGVAINLAQKLNGYHKRWAEENQGQLKPLSAKAKGPEAVNGMRSEMGWKLEVSFSPTNSGGIGNRPNEGIERLIAQAKAQLKEKNMPPPVESYVENEENPL